MRMIKDCDPGFYNELKDKLFPSEKNVFITTGRAHGKTATIGDMLFNEHRGGISFMKSGTDVAFSKSELTIKDVIFNDPATIVYWSDGSKTVVKCQPGDAFSEELGLAMAISKKFLGNKGNFNDVFKSFLPEKVETPEYIPTFAEMRDNLIHHCGNTPSCRRCSLKDFIPCAEKSFVDMNVAEIREAYKIVFGKKG